MKILYLDFERGSQTLGSKDKIQDMFGYPMLTMTTWDQFQSIVSKLYTKKKVVNTIKIGNLEIPEESVEVLPKNGTVVDALILDTFSELSKKFQRSLTDKNGKMKLQDWGVLKSKLDTALDFITSVPGVVICNVHSKIQTMDDGTSKILPYIDGGTKEDISKWFDFVFYARTVLDPSGKRQYIWITKRSEMFDNAKDRTDLLPVEMPQDYDKVIKAAKQKGFDNVRILVIGSPGSGKTYSLQTLVNGGSNENVES
jgi:hypothetical protein